MKKNCQIWKANYILSSMRPDLFSSDKYEARIDKDGNLVICNGTIYEVITIDKIAEYIDMPLWEIIMVDECGFDVYAILFFED